MRRYARNTAVGLMGLSAALLAALPATAGGGHGKHWHKRGKVTIVKKVIHAPVHHHWRGHHRHRRVVHHYAPPRVVVHRYAPVRVVHHDYYGGHGGYYGGGYGSRTLTGGVIGAAVGALAGNGIGSGSGRVAAIVGGAVLGAIVGGNIGQSMDRVDVLHTANVLETAPTGNTVAWRNPDSGIPYSVTPTRTWQLETGRYCREYTTTGVIHGREERLYGTACRMPDGSWQLQG